MTDSQRRSEYQEIADRIIDSLDFMESCGSTDPSTVSTVDFFTSHEGLILEYESAVTTKYRSKHYNVGAHFIWIGDRTRQL